MKTGTVTFERVVGGSICATWMPLYAEHLIYQWSYFRWTDKGWIFSGGSMTQDAEVAKREVEEAWALSILREVES